MKLKSLVTGGSLLALLMMGSLAHGGIPEMQKAYKDGDYTRALSEAKPLAQKGNLDAQAVLATVYWNGLGVPKNYIEGFKWSRKGAEHGDVEAQLRVALGYFYGFGTTKDFREAAKWLDRAASQGNVVAQTMLGGLYHSGTGVVQDSEQAAKLYFIASSNGSSMAQSALGDMFAKGEVVVRSPVVAFALYSVAEATESSALVNGAAKRDSLVGRMSQSEISAGNALARELTESRNYIQTIHAYLKRVGLTREQ